MAATTLVPDRAETGDREDPRPRRFTHDEYMRMGEAGILTEDDPVELIHGQIVKMSPENTPHRASIIKLTRTLIDALDAGRYAVQPQSTLPLDAHNAPEPDLAVLRGTPDELVDGELPVVLAVEVADSPLERDRDIKQSLYAVAGIPVYWIVNLQARTVEVYTEPEGERYRERTTRSEDETVSLPGDTDATIAVQSLLPAVDTDE